MIELSWCYADAERLLLPSLNNPSVDHAFKCMRDRSPLTRICMFPPVPREHCHHVRVARFLLLKLTQIPIYPDLYAPVGRGKQCLGGWFIGKRVERLDILPGLKAEDSYSDQAETA